MEDLFLKLYPLVSEKKLFSLEPAVRTRDWMVKNPHSFKCFPITNCNSFGWDLFTSEEVTVKWNGGNKPSDLEVTVGQDIGKTNFGFGILTFHPGYTWHTSPEWSLMISPIPNQRNTVFSTISALVETCSLKYPFFVSVNLLVPGEHTIPARTPICRILPVKVNPVVACQPVIEQEPRDFIEYRMWQSNERTKFLNDPEEKKKSKGWQKFYASVADNVTIKMKEIISPFNKEPLVITLKDTKDGE